MRRLIAAVVVSSLLAACGGGGGAATSGSGTSGVTPPVSAQEARGTLVVVLPGSSTASSALAQARHVKPMYVSPSTNAAQWSAVGTGGTTGTFGGIADLSSGSSLCIGTGSGRTCTIPFAVLPGTYTFTLKTFDAAPVNGAIPSSAKQLAVSSLVSTVTLNAANSLAFVLSGIVSGVTTTGLAVPSYVSTPADGGQHTIALSIQVTDPDGNIISGSAPYASSIPVSLAESGGSSHMQLALNGAVVGTSATLTKPTDTLAVVYDGGGSPGYGSVVSIGATSPATVQVSPMYVLPGTLTTTKLVQSLALAISESHAPASIAYSVAPSSCPSTTSGSSSGSGASATGTISINVPGGTNATCAATVSDITGTQLSVPITYAVSGPITTGGVTGTGVTGTCASTVSFSGAGQVASIAASDPGFGGTLSVSSSNTAVATAAASGTTVTVTAVAAGTATVTLSDPAGNVATCAIGVTTTGGSVSYVPIGING